ETSGEVSGLADRGVVHAQVATDGAHHHLAGVEADTDARVCRVALHGLLHAEGGVAGAYRVVLVGHRRAEERHDPVAHHLVHGALVVVHGFDHALEHGL